jgi:hypothetical protein
MGVCASKLGLNGCRIGVLIQMIFCLFFRQLVWPKNWVKMGGLLGYRLRRFLGHFFDWVTRPKNWVKMSDLIGLGLSLIEPSDTLFADIHSTSISEWFRGEFLGGFGLKIGA